VIEGLADKGEKGNEDRILWGWGDSLQWIESSLDLPVTIAILSKSALGEIQLIMYVCFAITQGSDPVH
jgi:hypothetical protein